MYVQPSDLINNKQEDYKKKFKPIHTFYPRIINETNEIIKDRRIIKLNFQTLSDVYKRQVMYNKLSNLKNNKKEDYKKKVKPIHTFFPRIINETVMQLSRQKKNKLNLQPLSKSLLTLK